MNKKPLKDFGLKPEAFPPGTNIVIAGCGFGGMYTYLNLKKSKVFKDIKVTLIDKNNYFLFTPMIHEVATGGLHSDLVVESIRELTIGSPNSLFLNELITSIDTNKKLLTLQNNQTISYDFFVLATGAKTNYFGNSKLQKNTTGLKSLQDALKIKNQILQQFEDAHCILNDPNENNEYIKSKLTFVIVGGGATGVELACEIAEFVFEDCSKFYPDVAKLNLTNVKLISSTNTVIKNYSKKAQYQAVKTLKELNIDVALGEKAVDYENNVLLLKSGRKVKTNNVFWVPGVIPNIPPSNNPWPLNEQNRVLVNDYLQVEGLNKVYALGDVASYHPRLAQVAVQQAKTVAKNIESEILKQAPSKYKLVLKGKLLSLGQKHAIGEIVGLNLKGWYMWFLWRTVYLTKVIANRKKIQIALNWTLNLFSPRDITKIS